MENSQGLRCIVCEKHEQPLHALGDILDGGRVHLRERFAFKLDGRRGAESEVEDIDYMVVKCLSCVFVSQPSSGQGESDKEVVTKRKSGETLYYWSLCVKNEDICQFCSVA